MTTKVNEIVDELLDDDQFTILLRGITLEIMAGGSSGSSLAFLGKLDDVRIYNKALSAAEISSRGEPDRDGCAVAQPTLIVIDLLTLDVAWPISMASTLVRSKSDKAAAPSDRKRCYPIIPRQA